MSKLLLAHNPTMFALAFLVGLAVLAPHLTADAQGRRQHRVKIDKVDTSDAPVIHIHTTFLTPNQEPVNPEFIDLVEIEIDGIRQDTKGIERSVWAQRPEGTDLILVLPATKQLGASAFKVLQETMPEMIKGLGKEDRVGMVVYSRSVTEVAQLSAEKTAGDEYAKAVRTGARPFMYSSLDKAITMLQNSPEKRKKAIVFVGDGTDAGTISVNEYNEKTAELVTRARKANVKIWCVGFASGGINSSDVRTLRLISRKTGATYREAGSQRLLRERLDQTIGEIVGQLILSFSADVKEQQVYEFVVRIQSEKSSEVVSEPYKEKVEAVAINWILWIVVCSLCCILSGIVLIVLFYVLYRIRKARARKEAEELLADLLADREEKCDVCHRTTRPEWDECFFCAQGMEPLKIREREPPFVYDDQDNRLCNTCGRVCAMDWQACAFCAQGQDPLPEWKKKKQKEAMLLGQIDPEEMTAQMLKEQEEQQAAIEAAQAAALANQNARVAEMAQGGGECPTCKRIMKPDWPECLYCASGLPPLDG